MKISSDARLPQNESLQALKQRLYEMHRETATLLNATSDAVTGVTAGPAVSRVHGLTGTPNAAAPLTKYDLSADAVVLRNAAGGTVARYLTGTIANDLGLAGSTANGRDQAAVFGVSQWIYLYFIWNGATLATISSLAMPTVGPALPPGYTHWAFATALRWNAASNIIPSIVRGSRVFYDAAAATVRVLTSGNATALTTVNCSSLVPPQALRAALKLSLSLTNATVAGFFFRVRITGFTAAINIVAADVAVAGGGLTITNVVELPLGASQQIDYQLTSAPTTGGGNIDVLGYTIPNGDA